MIVNIVLTLIYHHVLGKETVGKETWKRKIIVCDILVYLYSQVNQLFAKHHRSNHYSQK